MNKYLEKVASLQGLVDSEISAFHDRHKEIEEPINEMYSAADSYQEDLHKAHPELKVARSLGVSELSKFYTERAMRKSLDTDGAHRNNSITTAQKLLALKNIQAELDERKANNVIRQLQAVKPESNGYRTLRNIGTAATAIGGGVGGAMAGAKAGQELGGILGLVGGGLAGGFAGHYGLNALMKNTIKDRDSDIHEIREKDMATAYERLRNVLDR